MVNNAFAWNEQIGVPFSFPPAAPATTHCAIKRANFRVISKFVARDINLICAGGTNGLGRKGRSVEQPWRAMFHYIGATTQKREEAFTGGKLIHHPSIGGPVTDLERRRSLVVGPMGEFVFRIPPSFGCHSERKKGRPCGEKERKGNGSGGADGIGFFKRAVALVLSLPLPGTANSEKASST